jgi:hypothetical protein
LRTSRRPEDELVQLDLTSVLLTVAGLGIASAFAILAGAVSARVFFDATSDPEER